MKIRVFLRKDASGFWTAKAPSLGISGEGISPELAINSISEYFKDFTRKSTKVEIRRARNCYCLATVPPEAIIGAMIRCRRTIENLTLREAAKRIGMTSPNAFARYESGKSIPTVEKFYELLESISPDEKFYLG